MNFRNYFIIISFVVVQCSLFCLIAMVSDADADFHEFCNGEFNDSYAVKPNLILGDVKRKPVKETKENFWEPDTIFSIKYLNKINILVSNENKKRIPEFSCCAGDVNYAIYKNFLLVEVSTANSVRDSLIMLYKISNKRLKLIDIMSSGVGTGLDFVPALERTAGDIKQYGPLDEKIVMMSGGEKIKVADYDKDGKPEMIVVIDDENSKFENAGIQLYISFDENGFKLNKNPELYKPLLKRYAKLKGKVNKKYVYSILSKQKTLRLHMNNETRKYLKSILNWDYTVHNGSFKRKSLGFIECSERLRRIK